MAEPVANQNPTPSQVLGRANECLRRLLEAGLPFDALQKPIDDPKMRERLVGFWLMDGNKRFPNHVRPRINESNIQNPEWLRAREIMGLNFFGLEEAVKFLFFGMNPSAKDLASLTHIPFSEETLEKCKKTHVLVCVLPLSIVDMCWKFRKSLNLNKYVRDCDIQIFAESEGSAEWVLLEKTPTRSLATIGSQDERDERTLKSEERPDARTLVYAMLGYFLRTGAWLFEGYFVCCPDEYWIDGFSSNVVVGHGDSYLNDSVVFTISCCGSWNENAFLHFASIRKPDRTS